MCLSIILTRPLSPNVGYVFLCVRFHPHLIFSPLMKAQSLPLLPPNIAFLLLSFGADELFSLILTLIYFCSLLPLPSFCLTSFSPWPGLIQLLLPPPSARLPHLHFLSTRFLDSPSSMCSYCSASSSFPCCTYCSFSPVPSLPPPTVPCICPRAVSVHGGGNTYTICCAPES